VFLAVDAPRSVAWVERLVIRPGSLRVLAVATAVAWVPLLALVAISLARTNAEGGVFEMRPGRPIALKSASSPRAPITSTDSGPFVGG
jgi:hypothetical protein